MESTPIYVEGLYLQFICKFENNDRLSLKP